MKPSFYRKVLGNGLTVIFEKRNIPVVAVGYAVRCGGANESSDEKGISHFVEHLLYKGTGKRNAKQIAEAIEKNGGELNGFTDETITGYWCKMPSKNIDIALDVLTDMVKNPVFDEAELKKERKVILEEMKMRKDNPQIYVYDKVQEYLYEAPLGEDLIGTEKTMSSIDRKKILERFKKTYAPENIIFCVVGDVDFEKVVEHAEKNFGKEKGKIPRFEVKKRNFSSIEKRKGIDQANLVYAFHSPLAKSKESFAAIILDVIMGGGMSSRLFSEIREKRNLAYSVHASSKIENDFSYSVVYVGTKKESVDEVKALIMEEFEKVSKELGDEELRQAKEQIIGNYQISMEDSVRQMAALMRYEIQGNAGDFYKFEKDIKAVKISDVKKLASEALKKNSFFALVPE